MKRPTIVEFVTEAAWIGITLSPAQAVLLRAIYGLALDEDEQEIWRTCTGRTAYAGQEFAEVTVIAGARAGKDSRIAAPIVLYEALFGGHEAQLGKGERGVIPLIAQDQRATRVAFGYIRDYAVKSPTIQQLIAEEREAELRFTNRMAVACFACTAKSVRGWSIPAAVMDELAFFRAETGADTDVEVQAAVRRGMVGFGRTRLVKISTPYAKGGVLYEDYQRYWGRDEPDVLVWKAPSRYMNPALSSARMARERRMDAERFAREYEAEFVEDLTAFLPGAWIEGAVTPGVHERAADPAERYVVAVDPSGGGADSFTVAVVHLAGARVVQDVMRGWVAARGETMPLAAVVGEIAALAARYGQSEVIGDRYAGQWVAQEFERAGVAYRVTEQDKSRAYLEAEPLFAQGRIDLLDHERLVRELRLLERRHRVGGRALVDHPRGGHDDYANAVCLAAATAVAELGDGALQVYTFPGAPAEGAVAAAERPVSDWFGAAVTAGDATADSAGWEIWREGRS